MPHAAAARTATRDEDAGRYQRHRPEQTLRYRIVEQHYPTFTAHLAERGRELPGYVQRQFDDYLKCGRLEHGFLRVRRNTCHAEHLVTFSCKRRGFYSGLPALRPLGQLKLFYIAPGDLVPQLRRAAHGRECSAAGR